MENSNDSKVTLYFDTRRPLNNGDFPIKLRVYHQELERLIPIGNSCLKKHWIFGDSENSEYIKAIEKGEIKYVSSKAPSSKRTNNQIDFKFKLIDRLIKENKKAFENINPDELKRIVKEKLKDPEMELKHFGKRSSTLHEGFTTKLAELEEGQDWGNHRIYYNSICIWSDYLTDIGLNDIELVDIDKGTLVSFEQYCKSNKRGRIRKGKQREGMQPNSISIPLRCLRHIINRAIDDKNEVITQADYPFRGYTLPKNKTIKKATNKDDLELLRQLKLDKSSPEWHHRNYFLFMFNNQGMNLIDLAFLKREQIEGDRINYSRSKTRGKVVFDIKLTEESLEILELYEYRTLNSDELVFPFMSDIYGKYDSKYTHNTYRNRIGDHNKFLKKLADKAEIETNLTSYVARHTWASVGFEEFENLDVVGQGLGHQSDPKVTKVYAKDLKKKRIDNINEQITSRKNRITTSK